MRKYILMCLLLFLVMTCNSQEKPVDDLKLETYFYPSSGGGAIYSIELKNDSLIVKNHEPINKSENSLFIKKLSNEELNNLSQIVDLVKKRENVQPEIVLDSWRVEVKVNGVTVYDESDVRIKTLPEDIKRLINFLTKNSTVKIELYDFS
jgi:hypothetical protein